MRPTNDSIGGVAAPPVCVRRTASSSKFDRSYPSTEGRDLVGSRPIARAHKRSFKALSIPPAFDIRLGGRLPLFETSRCFELCAFDRQRTFQLTRFEKNKLVQRLLAKDGDTPRRAIPSNSARMSNNWDKPKSGTDFKGGAKQAK